MKFIDKSKTKFADGVGYLYRAALYLAKGEKKVASTFLQRAVEQVNVENTKELKTLLKELNGEENSIHIAEKVLDHYKKLSFLLR